MEFFNSGLGRNITFVRPAYFIISGFITVPNVEYYYVFLFILYTVSVLGNTVVMTVIVLDPNLKTPKYIAVFNLALADLCSSSSLVPKILDLFFFNRPRIAYGECLAFLFFCFTCLTMQSLNLMALAYDRLVAIFFPLQYVVKVTHRSMLSLVVVLWLLSITLNLVIVGFLTRLSFCKSVVIHSFFCDQMPLFRLACNDFKPSFIIANVSVCVVLVFPLLFIVFSYCMIGYALAKISTLQERMKALKTCTSHLSLVAIYFLPVMSVYFFSATVQPIHPNVRIVNLSLTAVLPPLLNPIVYVLQTDEVKLSVKKLLRFRR